MSAIADREGFDGAEWLTTLPNPRQAGWGMYEGQRGWRLHAIVDPKWDIPPHPWDLNGQMRSKTRALCGLRPSHGWGMDLYIDERCERCERALARRAK